MGDGAFVDPSRESVLSGHQSDLVLEHQLTGLEREPQVWARSIRLPTLLFQVHDDVLTEPSDVQTIFGHLATPEKQLSWITGSTRR